MAKTLPNFIPEGHCLDGCDHKKPNETNHFEDIPKVVRQMLNAWSSKDCFEHISPISMPSQGEIIDIVLRARRIIFPGFFGETRLHASNIEYYIGKATTSLYEKLTEQINVAICHDCRRNCKPCNNCDQQSADLAFEFIKKLPAITEVLAQDIRASIAGDPAIKSPDEVIFCYPGLLATLIYRLAHELFLLEVPFLPRIMSEYAHSMTGIDIHPGATIGEGFFMDHGTGIVIGETTIIGNNVRLYQGVTLGALSLPRDAGERMRSMKRHPSIEDDVIVYANTTILGGDTIIGEGAIIGGNNWITKSVTAGSRVLIKMPDVIVK
ncbi:MAG: serine acetyltransferase [Desulfotalea sp.]